MGLDVYVGSLSRYYTHDWETIIQKTAREQGMESLVLRLNEIGAKQPEKEEVYGLVHLWQQMLKRTLAKHTPERVEWNEDPNADYSTDKPGWEGLWALRLWAAHDEQPKHARPRTLPINPERSKAYKACASSTFKSRYSHALREIDLWLPIAVRFTFAMKNVGGAAIEIGSSVSLATQLDDLNARTWKAGASDIDAWSVKGPPEDNDFEATARFGFAVFHRLANEAMIKRTPMLLDY